MLLLFDSYFKPDAIFFSLALYTFLFFFCIYAYHSRTSNNINHTLHLTLIISIFGVLNSALQIGAPYTGSDMVLAIGLFFGLTLAPLTWTVGINFFLVLFERKRPLQVLLGNMLTLVQFVLIVVCVVYVGELLDGNDYLSDIDNIRIYDSLLVSIVLISWGYFLLFFWLVIQYKPSMTKFILISVIIFGVLNTVRLITETAFLFTGSALGIEAKFYIMFFFTDFVSCVALCVATFYWKIKDDQLPVE